MPNQYTKQDFNVGKTSEVFNEMRAYGHWYPRRDSIIASALACRIPKARIADTMQISKSAVDRVERKLAKGAASG